MSRLEVTGDAAVCTSDTSGVALVSPFVRRLWKWAVGWALALVILVGSSFILPDDPTQPSLALGGDFIAFYTAGSMVNQDRAHLLYDLDAVREFQQALRVEQQFPDTVATLTPWWNPPFVAWVFAPLAKLSYPVALGVWEAINAVCLLTGLLILSYFFLTPKEAQTDLESPRPACRGFLSHWKTWGLFVLLVICSSPALQTFSHAQNTGVTLLLLSGVVVCWTQRRAMLAGLLAGLLFYKPQHAAILSVCLVIFLGRRALLGLLMTGTTLLLLDLATLPGAMQRWLVDVPINLANLQNNVAYFWDRHVTIRSFWRLVYQGTDVGPTETMAWGMGVVCVVGVGAVIALTIWRARRTADLARFDRRTISLILLSTPLLLPFCFDYDLLLLAVPVALYASERVTLSTPRDVWLTRSWIALYVWTFVNPGLAGRIDFNGTVLVLGAVLALEVRRCWRDTGAGAQSTDLTSTDRHAPRAIRHPWTLSEAA